MKDRIKAIRKEQNMTQQEFADKLGISRAPIASCEIGRTEPTGSLIALICRTFDVNEVWLRTGEGEMHIPRTRQDELAAYMGQVIGGKCTDMEEAIIATMSRLSLEEWQLIRKFTGALMEEMKKPS